MRPKGDNAGGVRPRKACRGAVTTGDGEERLSSGEDRL